MTLLPSALPKFRFGLHRHCSWSPSLLLAQFWFLCVPAPAHQAASHTLCWDAARAQHTNYKICCPQTSVILHLLICPWPLSFPSTHPGPIKQHYLQRAGTPYPLCCGVQPTLCCLQHRPHWFYWGTILPSVILPNTHLVQSESVKAD